MVMTTPRRGGRRRGRGSSSATHRRISPRLANKPPKNYPDCFDLSPPPQLASQIIAPNADSIASTTMKIEIIHFEQNDGSTLAAEHMQDAREQTHQLQDGSLADSHVQAAVEEANLQREEVVKGTAALLDGENATEDVRGDEDLRNSGDEEVKDIHQISVGTEWNRDITAVNVIPPPPGFASTNADESTPREEGNAAFNDFNNDTEGAGQSSFQRSSQQHASSSLHLTEMADLMEDDDSFEIDCAGCGDRILVDGYKVTS